MSDATAATALVVAVRSGDRPADVSLLLVDARARGVHVRRLPGFLSWQCEVTFEGVDAQLLGAEHQGWAALERALHKALPVLCSYLVVCCQASRDVGGARRSGCVRVRAESPARSMTRHSLVKPPRPAR